MGRKKIALIGAGNIGGLIAQNIVQRRLGDIVIIDINRGIAVGKALDLSESNSIFGYDVNIVGSEDYKEIVDSDVIIVTAGLPRKPGMTRADLLKSNKEIISGVAKHIHEYAPNAFVIVVTNPLDQMVFQMYKSLGFSANKVVGMAGILDSARFSHFLSLETGVSVSNINAMVLGGHGDKMVPLLSFSTISGVSLTKIIEKGIFGLTKQKVDEIVERTRNGGGEILKLFGNGSAFFAPAASAVQMAESYLLDRNFMIPCSAYLSGEYGVSGMYVGVPVIIGKEGVSKIIELDLSDEEFKSLSESVEDMCLSNKIMDDLG